MESTQERMKRNDDLAQVIKSVSQMDKGEVVRILIEIAADVNGAELSEVRSERRTYEAANARQMVMAWMVIRLGMSTPMVAHLVGSHCRGRAHDHTLVTHAVKRVGVKRATREERVRWLTFDNRAMARFGHEG